MAVYSCNAVCLLEGNNNDDDSYPTLGARQTAGETALHMRTSLNPHGHPVRQALLSPRSRGGNEDSERLTWAMAEAGFAVRFGSKPGAFRDMILVINTSYSYLADIVEHWGEKKNLKYKSINPATPLDVFPLAQLKEFNSQ